MCEKEALLDDRSPTDLPMMMTVAAAADAMGTPMKWEWILYPSSFFFFSSLDSTPTPSLAPPPTTPRSATLTLTDGLTGGALALPSPLATECGARPRARARAPTGAPPPPPLLLFCPVRRANEGISSENSGGDESC